MNVATGAASIVEPQGFSGSLPVMFSMCCKLCDFIQANKDVLFCSVLFCSCSCCGIALELNSNTGDRPVDPGRSSMPSYFLPPDATLVRY